MLTVVTDHNPLVYLQTQAVLSRRQTRWSEYLQMFTYKWLYRPGKSNVADPLSRSPGVVAAMLPVAGPDALCRCAAVHCKGPKQQTYIHTYTIAEGGDVSCIRTDSCLARNRLREDEHSIDPRSRVYNVAMHGTALYWRRCKPAWHCDTYTCTAMP